MNPLNQTAAEILRRLREQKPLILNLTNNVVQSITANMLLAVGGVPVMLTHSGNTRPTAQLRQRYAGKCRHVE